MSSDGQDHLSKAEISKDALQSGAQAAIGTVGEVATIITGAVKDVAGALGGLATELFEIRDASQRAIARHVEPGADVEVDLELGDEAGPGALPES
ncbi:hypothetical protein [Nocardioides sp. MH1]|uniref:hypothetical protein n=1 Tax=Nocardioides sp. MH1 TaxID=3242490 RepID=UPI003521AFE5